VNRDKGANTFCKVGTSMALVKEEEFRAYMAFWQIKAKKNIKKREKAIKSKRK